MKKRSVKIRGHATSISLEEEFWTALKSIASDQNKSLSALIAEIDQSRRDQNLSSALRVYTLKTLENKLSSSISTAK